MNGENLDLTSEAEFISAGQAPAERRFLGVHFECCDVYTRVYINRDETCYCGNCPKCGRQVKFRVGAGGTDHRFFRAS